MKLYQRKRLKEISKKKNKNHEEIIDNLKKAKEDNIKAYNIYSRNFKNNLNYNNSTTQIDLLSTKNNLISSLKNEFQDNEKNEGYNLIRFENVWKEQQIKENKYNKNKKDQNKIMYDYIDIFDENYDKYKKKCEEYTEKN
jgi:hypothetical protein